MTDRFDDLIARSAIILNKVGTKRLDDTGLITEFVDDCITIRSHANGPSHFYIGYTDTGMPIVEIWGEQVICHRDACDYILGYLNNLFTTVSVLSRDWPVNTHDP